MIISIKYRNGSVIMNEELIERLQARIEKLKIKKESTANYIEELKEEINDIDCRINQLQDHILELKYS